MEVVTPSNIIATFALLFTVGSFWWVNARRGRLRSFTPHAFAAHVSGSVVYLRLPLVLHNSGATSLIVQDIRIRFLDVPDSIRPLPWHTTYSQLTPMEDDGHAFPSVFSVAGRTAQQFFVQFGGPWPGFSVRDSDHKVRIEVKLGHARKWKMLHSFTLRTSNIRDGSIFVTYSNIPNALSKTDRKQINKTFKKLTEEFSEKPGAE